MPPQVKYKSDKASKSITLLEIQRTEKHVK